MTGSSLSVYHLLTGYEPVIMDSSVGGMLVDDFIVVLTPALYVPALYTVLAPEYNDLVNIGGRFFYGW